MLDDPISLFQALLREATSTEHADATACALATATPDGWPSVRIVLLKDVSTRGFTFFTNYGSRKAAELEHNPRAALCFHWPGLGVQVRVEGRTTRVSREESTAYFGTRPRESQLGAWASEQSAPLPSREDLLRRYQDMDARFGSAPVPCPDHWGGYRVEPARIEIWRSREFRLHERTSYTRTNDGWSVQLLNP
jgi:pyridoxamine 5'-phosphate oxidase